MKKFRTLLAIVAVCAFIVSMSMAVFADDVLDAVVFNAETVDFTGAAGDTIEVAILSGATDIDVIQAGGIHVNFDTAKWEYVSVAYNTAALTSLDNVDRATGGDLKLVPNVNAGIIIPKNTEIAKVTFKALTADSSSEFVLSHNDEWDLYASAGEPYYDYNDTLVVVQKVEEQKEAPVYTEVTDGEGVFAGADVTYTGVWTGAYTVTLNGNAAEKVKVDFDAERSYTLNSNVKGDGTIAFKIAVIGAPKNAKAVPSVFGTEWVAAVKAAE